VSARSPQQREARAFTAPQQPNQRRYEALRAVFVDELTHAEAGERFGYTRDASSQDAREMSRLKGREGHAQVVTQRKLCFRRKSVRPSRSSSAMWSPLATFAAATTPYRPLLPAS
jgi:hypothetical protein